jgi:hypothetical protein
MRMFLANVLSDSSPCVQSGTAALSIRLLDIRLDQMALFPSLAAGSAPTSHGRAGLPIVT